MKELVRPLPHITPSRATRFAELLSNPRLPHGIRAQGEYLVRAFGSAEAELVSFDSGTGTLSSRVLSAPGSDGIAVFEAHPPIRHSARPQGNAFTSFLIVMLLMILGLLGWALISDTRARAAATLAQGEAWRIAQGEAAPGLFGRAP
ncbi:MAG: hypothetical protein JG765_2176 [Cereibacter sp.]|jgi:hypothetical protein|nr:hypothetical protein [Cereibacter sp.]